MSRIKLGLIGCGAVADLCHLPALWKVPIFKVVSLCDRETARAEYLKKKFFLEDAEIYSDFSDLINRSDADAVLILTPPKLHAQICLEAATLGKHIFCEKPFTMNLQEADKVMEALRETNVKFMIGLSYRFSSENLKFKEFLQRSWIGKIKHAETFMLANIQLWPSVSKFQYAKQEGGGALFEMGCHHIDLLSWLLGKVRSVSATIKSKILQTVDDYAEVKLEFENGVKADTYVSWVELEPKYEVNITGEKGKMTVRMRQGEGTEAFIHLENKFVFRQGPLKLVLDLTRTPHQRELLHFGNCIKNDIQPSPGIDEAVENVRIISAAYESSRLGREIKFPEGETA